MNKRIQYNSPHTKVLYELEKDIDLIFKNRLSILKTGILSSDVEKLKCLVYKTFRLVLPNVSKDDIRDSILEFIREILLKKVSTYSGLLHEFSSVIPYFSSSNIYKKHKEDIILYKVFFDWYSNFPSKKKNSIIKGNLYDLFWIYSLSNIHKIMLLKNEKNVISRIELIFKNSVYYTVHTYNEIIKIKNYIDNTDKNLSQLDEIKSLLNEIKNPPKIPWRGYKYQLAYFLRECKDQGAFNTYEEAYSWAEKHMTWKGNYCSASSLEISYESNRYKKST